MLHRSTNPWPDSVWSLSISASLGMLYTSLDICKHVAYLRKLKLLSYKALFLNNSKFYPDWLELIKHQNLFVEEGLTVLFIYSHFTLLLAPAFSVYFSLSVRTTPFSPQPYFRLQYSLDVADRLADEHVLIGLYVNMLQNNPSRLVQAGHLGGDQPGESRSWQTAVPKDKSRN